jgi:hypothetical protein
MTWKDLNWKQYHALMTKVESGADNLDYVSVVYDIDLEDLKQKPVNEVMDLIKSVSFISELPKKETFKVNSLIGYPLPSDIGGWPFGLIEDIKALTMQVVHSVDQVDTMQKNYPLIVASAYQYLKDGNYNSTEAAKLVPTIEDLPWMDIYSIVDFFFLKSIGLEVGMKNAVKTFPTNQKKYKLELKTLLNKWVCWLQSKFSLGGILRKKTAY